MKYALFLTSSFFRVAISSPYTRNTLDLSAVPMLHELSHLPVVVDPSHATGLARLVTPMALAATAASADGIMVEVHNDPIFRFHFQ